MLDIETGAERGRAAVPTPDAVRRLPGARVRPRPLLVHDDDARAGRGPMSASRPAPAPGHPAADRRAVDVRRHRRCGGRAPAAPRRQRDGAPLRRLRRSRAARSRCSGWPSACAGRRVELVVEPVVERGIPGDPAVDDKRALRGRRRRPAGAARRAASSSREPIAPATPRSSPAGPPPSPARARAAFCAAGDATASGSRPTGPVVAALADAPGAATPADRGAR